MPNKFKAGDVVYLNSASNFLMTVIGSKDENVLCGFLQPGRIKLDTWVLDNRLLSIHKSAQENSENYEIGDVVYFRSHPEIFMTVVESNNKSTVCKAIIEGRLIDDSFSTQCLTKKTN